MKPIRLTRHAKQQAVERGVLEEEIFTAIREDSREPSKLSRWLCRYNFPYDAIWCGHKYAIKQVAPVIKEEPDEIVVITVYSFYF